MCFLRRPQNLTKSSLSIWHLLHNVKLTVKISSVFVAFLENMNFTFCMKIKCPRGRTWSAHLLRKTQSNFNSGKSRKIHEKGSTCTFCMKIKCSKGRTWSANLLRKTQSNFNSGKSRKIHEKGSTCICCEKIFLDTPYSTKEANKKTRSNFWYSRDNKS